MAKRRNDTLKRRVGSREYRDVCWVSPEGRTEADYLVMDAFKDSSVTVRFPCIEHRLADAIFQNLSGFENAVVLLEKQIELFLGSYVTTPFLLMSYPKLAIK